jgi:(1->4)-alpha-D-glucan 1-alpha-D-glucosylmutase
MTSPGVPDFYQGCDLWDLRLVDPDNRGPVDFNHRAALLDEIEKRSKQDLPRLGREFVQNWQDGRIKLFLIWKVLNLRRQYPRVFLDGQFLPMKAIGKRANNLIAYARRQRDVWIMTVVPRWLAGSKAPLSLPYSSRFWLGSHIVLPADAPQSWVNVLTGDLTKASLLRQGTRLPMRDVFGNFPVAVLSGISKSVRKN